MQLVRMHHERRVEDADVWVMSGATRSGGHRRGASRLSVRALLLLAVLVPTSAMGVTIGASVSSTWTDRRAAEGLEQEVGALVAIVDARAALADEQLTTSVLLIAAGYDVGPDELETLYEVDYVAQLADVREVVDQDPTIASDPRLQGDLEQLAALRPRVDALTVDYPEVSSLLSRFSAHLDELWSQRGQAFEAAQILDAIPVGTRSDLEVLDQTYALLSAANLRAELAWALLTEPAQPGQVSGLLAADERFRAAREAIRGRLGPAGTEAWQRYADDPDLQAFEATLVWAGEVGLAGAPPPLGDDSVALGEAFDGGARVSQELTDLVRAAAVDLGARTRSDASAATRTVVLRSTLAMLLALVSLGAAALLARTVAQPVRRLGVAARDVRDGRFDLQTIDPRGPRELVETAETFNEMAATLAAVEAQAVMLAEDPWSAEHPPFLPGRTGRALHVALERLRSSMRAAAEQREELHELAIHDSLTGLLNRGAALEAMGRDLAGGTRHGRRTMVLFVDLDGLKQVNDGHGHDAGDAALRLVADALRATTREADVVARYGGDEFLVAGAVDGRAEVEAFAERIRGEVASRALHWDGVRLSIRCSIGMAISGPETTTAEALITEADGAVYGAKHEGRDRVAWGPVTAAR
jgi:diguanylate cyclase (GGDEF)-like protein